ncbi:MAG: ASCH domain-containing protein [Nanoarchaeota archaeon]
MKKILHLNLFKKYFKQIANGEKKIEYREIKPYWTKRLVGTIYDEVHFRNGYQKNAPFMRVRFEKLTVSKEYEIHLGKILEIKNYP